MENRYPLFAGGRILKKEALWDLRDYAYENWQLYYGDYTDGIIKGCEIRVEGANLVVGRGILKYRDLIYLLREETVIPFAAENRLMVLKVSFQKKEENPDWLIYVAEFFWDDTPMLLDNQIELCRFHLRTGSVLRDTYKNFSDMNTEYDTINLLHATVAGCEQGRVHPKVLQKYADEMQGSDGKSIEDAAFCYHILQTAGRVERKVINAYLRDRMKEEEEWDQMDTEQCFERLEALISHRVDRWGDRQKHRVIFVE